LKKIKPVLLQNETIIIYIATQGVTLNKGKERPRTIISLSRIILPRSPSRSFFVMLISNSNVSAIHKKRLEQKDKIKVQNYCIFKHVFFLEKEKKNLVAL